MSIREAYNHWSATYDTDENRTRDLDHAATRETLKDKQYKSILEIGCGTGKNTPLLAQSGDRVLALDFSEGMLKKAREKLDSDHVLFLAADITKPWPCADESADLIACNLVLEHIEDVSFVFSEALRTLIEGGHLFMCELHPFRQYQGTKARFQRNEGRIEIQAFTHHISDYLKEAEKTGLRFKTCREWWHEEDQDKPPRLVSFSFEK